MQTHTGAFIDKTGKHRKDAEMLLHRLGEEMRVVNKLAADALAGDISEGLHRFRKFRNKVSELQALITLIDDRLNRMRDDATADLRIEIDKADARLMVLVVDTSIWFFETFQDMDIKPLGTREACELELRSLREIKGRMEEADFMLGDRGTELKGQLEHVLEVLQGIIKESPGLREF
jgi:hypothetical protein